METIISLFLNFFSQENITAFMDKIGIPTAIGAAVGVGVFAVVRCIPILFSKDNTEDPEYFISLKNAEKLRAECRRLNYSAMPDFWSADVHEIQRCYNGLGPSKWSPKLKKFVAKVLEIIEGASLVHDYEWVNCDKSLFSFIMINIKFICNCVREARFKKSWKIAALGSLIAILNMTLGWKIYKSSSI